MVVEGEGNWVFVCVGGGSKWCLQKSQMGRGIYRLRRYHGRQDVHTTSQVVGLEVGFSVTGGSPDPPPACLVDLMEKMYEPSGHRGHF